MTVPVEVEPDLVMVGLVPVELLEPVWEFTAMVIWVEALVVVEFVAVLDPKGILTITNIAKSKRSTVPTASIIRFLLSILIPPY